MTSHIDSTAAPGTFQSKPKYIHIPSANPDDLGYMPLESNIGDEEMPTSATTEGQMSYEEWPGNREEFDSLEISPVHCNDSGSRRWKPVATLRRKMRKVSDGLAAKFSPRASTLQFQSQKRKPSNPVPFATLVKGKKKKPHETKDTDVDIPLWPTDLHGFPTTSVYHHQEGTLQPIMKRNSAETNTMKDFESLYGCYDASGSSDSSIATNKPKLLTKHSTSSEATIRTSGDYNSKSKLIGKPPRHSHESDSSTATILDSFLKSQRQTLKYQDRLRESELQNLEMKMDIKIRELKENVKEQITHVKSEAELIVHGHILQERYAQANYATQSWLPIRQEPPWWHQRGAATPAPGYPAAKVRKVSGKRAQGPINSDDYAYTPQSPEVNRKLEEFLYNTTSGETDP